MKIRKIKLGNVNDFEEVQENFVQAIIKELYNNKINDCDYYTLQERIVFLHDIMDIKGEDYNNDLWVVFDCAYSMFDNQWINEAPYYKIYEEPSGIIWLVISQEQMECESDIYITKKELEANRGI